MNITNLHPSLIFLYAWALLWKGLALWHAAKNQQKYWFIALLFINTAGVVEIAYLFWFAKKKLLIRDLMFWRK